MTEGYFVWDQVPARKLLPQQGRLSRQALETSLYAFFLRLCLPYPRPSQERAPLYSPLNLTVFLRLVGHLSSIGYPSHWHCLVSLGFRLVVLGSFWEMRFLAIAVCANNFGDIFLRDLLQQKDQQPEVWVSQTNHELFLLESRFYRSKCPS
ncbi:hypothetical protein QBC38DRAFT_492290 [Podospora fimiseda]|uniref:Uncharacterized protein n=1 Tax=Podospora fimiseda TaxID=252190 RepID=A0AAN7BGH5_9PEZI|nr:hypothetical protein QBC38DRAFT_492290 [Podospora fimiseda]